MAEKLEKSSEANMQSRFSHTEATLMQYAREVVGKGRTTYQASQAAESVAGDPRAANSNSGVAEWVSTLESIRRDQRLSNASDMVSNVDSFVSGTKRLPS